MLQFLLSERKKKKNTQKEIIHLLKKESNDSVIKKESNDLVKESNDLVKKETNDLVQKENKITFFLKQSNRNHSKKSILDITSISVPILSTKDKEHNRITNLKSMSSPTLSHIQDNYFDIEKTKKTLLNQNFDFCQWRENEIERSKKELSLFENADTFNVKKKTIKELLHSSTFENKSEKKEILLIWNCFIDNDESLHRSFASLMSLQKYIENVSIVVISGSCINSDYYISLREKFDQLEFSNHLFQNADDVIKMWMVSTSPRRKDICIDQAYVRLKNEIFDYIFFMDGDILLKHQTISILLENIKFDTKIGVLAPQMEQDNRHLVTISKSQRFSIPLHPQHVAGGCVLIQRETFVETGGYCWWHHREALGKPCHSNCFPCLDKDKYDVEDVLFHFQVDRKKWKVQICNYAFIVHPYMENKNDEKRKSILSKKLERAKSIMESLS